MLIFLNYKVSSFFHGWLFYDNVITYTSVTYKWVFSPVYRQYITCFFFTEVTRIAIWNNAIILFMVHSACKRAHYHVVEWSTRICNENLVLRLPSWRLRFKSWSRREFFSSLKLVRWLIDSQSENQIFIIIFPCFGNGESAWNSVKLLLKRPI